MLLGCGGGSDGETAADVGVDPDGAVLVDAAPRADAEPPLTLRAVAGDLTYAEYGEDGTGHLYAVQIDGNLRQRITSEAAVWTHHSVNPDPRYVVAVRKESADGPGAIWIIDVQNQMSWPISPPECDAGIGGVGWRDEVQVLFAMKCGDTPSQVYLANRDNRSRELANLLAVTDHEFDARDVFTAANTAFYTYVLDADSCETGSCFTKPEVRVGLTDPPANCRLTDGDPMFTDTSTITGPVRRIGDHSPAFNRDLSKVVFSRNVGDKGRGPEGHHDIFRIGVDTRAAFRGDETCSQDSLENLTADLGLEGYRDATGAMVDGDERFPAPAYGRAPRGGLLYTGETHAGDGSGALFFVDLQGNKRAITPQPGRARYGRWITTADGFEGVR